MLSESYNEEQAEIAIAIPTLKESIEQLTATQTNTNMFVELAKQYIDIQCLTPEILQTFISKIVIHAREQKWSKKGCQQIDIYLNYIGKI